MIDAGDLTGMTFVELTNFVRQRAAWAKTGCPAKAEELAMMVRVMEERGPGDGNKTRQYIAETLNACPELRAGGRLLLWAGLGLLAWFLLKG